MCGDAFDSPYGTKRGLSFGLDGDVTMDVPGPVETQPHKKMFASLDQT